MLKMVVVIDMDTKGIVYKNDNEQEGSTFTCFRCGVCCSGYRVYLDMPEAKELAGHLGFPLQQFLDDYTDPRWPFKETFLLKQVLGVCIFLQQEEGSVFGLCKIHKFKPLACRQWKANLDRKECRLGLRQYWNLSVNDSGEIVGSPEDLLCFKTFLKTLD